MRGFLAILSFTALLITTLLCLSAPSVLAQETDLAIVEESGLQETVLGLGAALVPQYEGANEYEAVPLLQANLKWASGRSISLLGNSIKANVLADKTWHFGPMLQFRKERKEVDDDHVDRMEGIDSATELGLFGSYNTEKWVTMLSGVQDVSDTHDGSIFTIGEAYKIPLSNQKGLMALFATASYANDDYMDTYFSVNATDALRSGLSQFEAEGGFKDIGAGMAMQYNINENWGLLGVAKYTRLLGDAKDSPLVDDVGDANQYLAGLAANYRFGAKAEPAKDSDGDGVPDNLDRCPGTPQGVAVDQNGCPPDSDGDGVPDYLDKCPNTPQGVKVDVTGCPLDSDGDGVPDYLDKCPNTPKGAPVDQVGCPSDSDGDGVPDYLDKCPNTPKGELVDASGCTLKLTLHINFDFDKADIKPEFKKDLDNAALFIRQNSKVPYIIIGGHTDSVGDDAYNQTLSERRANAVRDALINEYGIPAAKLVARGYGETQPVADNATEDGRYQNRRVEVICCAIMPQ